MSPVRAELNWFPPHTDLNLAGEPPILIQKAWKGNEQTREKKNQRYFGMLRQNWKFGEKVGKLAFLWIFMIFLVEKWMWIFVTDLCRRIWPKIKTERAWCIFCEIIATGTWLRFENLEETGFHEKVTLKNNLSDKTCRLSFCRKRSLVLHVDCMYWNTLGLTSNFNQVISKIKNNVPKKQN